MNGFFHNARTGARLDAVSCHTQDTLFRVCHTLLREVQHVYSKPYQQDVLSDEDLLYI